jgi:hypothetical protein
MSKTSKANAEPTKATGTLKGWKQIAEFLGEPVSVVKRWKNEGMPVREEGRFVSSSPEDLTGWLGRESGKPIHIITTNTDLGSELKRAVAFARRSSKNRGREP